MTNTQKRVCDGLTRIKHRHWVDGDEEYMIITDAVAMIEYLSLQYDHIQDDQDKKWIVRKASQQSLRLYLDELKEMRKKTEELLSLLRRL